MEPGSFSLGAVLLAAMTTRQPSRARPRAIARPMPLLDPVTIATWPSSVPMSGPSPFLCSRRRGNVSPLAPRALLHYAGPTANEETTVRTPLALSACLALPMPAADWPQPLHVTPPVTPGVSHARSSAFIAAAGSLGKRQQLSR